MTIEKLCELIMDYAKDNDFAIEIRDEQDLDKKYNSFQLI